MVSAKQWIGWIIRLKKKLKTLLFTTNRISNLVTQYLARRSWIILDRIIAPFVYSVLSVSLYYHRIGTRDDTKV